MRGAGGLGPGGGGAEEADAAGPPAFGGLLRRWRLAAGLTQEALAERAGVGTRTIQSLERGGQRPYPITSERLRAALGLTGEARRRLAEATTAAPRAGRAVGTALPAHVLHLVPALPEGSAERATGRARAAALRGTCRCN